jgi:hypothetical protein
VDGTLDGAPGSFVASKNTDDPGADEPQAVAMAGNDRRATALDPRATYRKKAYSHAE